MNILTFLNLVGAAGEHDEHPLLARLLVEGEPAAVGNFVLAVALDVVAALLGILIREEKIPRFARTLLNDVQVSVVIRFDRDADLVSRSKHGIGVNFVIAAFIAAFQESILQRERRTDHVTQRSVLQASPVGEVADCGL